MGNQKMVTVWEIRLLMWAELICSWAAEKWVEVEENGWLDGGCFEVSSATKRGSCNKEDDTA